LLHLGAVAAGLAAVAATALLLPSLLREQTIQTQRGERREVSLADGSVIEVDPETRLSVAFEEHARRVTLQQGRALFKVAKNPQRPFLVDADGTTIRAIGTAFGVERQTQGVVVTVAEGKVGVFAADTFNHAADRTTSASGDADPGHRQSSREAATVFLTADQQVTVSRSGVAKSVHNVDSERELAWAKGQLVLDNETVAAAVEEFNRYNRLQLHVVNEEVARRSVSGIFNASDPESFIGFLQTVTPVRVTRGESEIIVR
jgi:transmembrane sensor